MLKRTALAGLGLVLLVSPLLASAQSLSDLQAQIQQLLAQIQALQQKANQTQGTSPLPPVANGSCASLTNSLSLDDTDADTNGDVSKLQQFLAQDSSIYPSGRITGYFGPSTLRAVQRWQSAHGLVSSGDPDTTGYGYVGPKTRAAMAQGCGGSTRPTQPTWPTQPNSQSVYLKFTEGNSSVAATFSIRDANGNYVSPVSIYGYAPYYDLTAGNYTAILDAEEYNSSGSGSSRATFKAQFYTDGQTYTVNGDTITIDGSAQSEISTWLFKGFVNGSSVRVTGSQYNENFDSEITLSNSNGNIVGTSRSVLPGYKLPVGQYTAKLSFRENSNSSYASVAYSVEAYNGGYLVTESTGTTEPPIPIASKTPVVSGVKGPASLSVGQSGTWTVNASVPNQPGAELSYSVVWGDEASGPYLYASSQAAKALQTSATFTHTYNYGGTYTPKFTVSNSAGSASAEMTVAVGANVSSGITVTAPNGGENWNIEGTYTIRYYLRGISVDANNPILIYLQKGYDYPSTKSGVNSGLLIATTKDTESYSYTVPADIASWPGLGNNFTIKVCASNCTVSDTSDSTFSIGKSEPQSITVTAPNGGEQWEIGQLNTITWNPYGYNPDVNPASDVKAYLMKKVVYSTGIQYNNVGEIIPSGKASIHWESRIRPPGSATEKIADPGEYYIDVQNIKTGATDKSDAPFTLLPRAVDMKVNGSDGPVTLSDNQPITITLTTSNVSSCTLSGTRPASGIAASATRLPMSGSVNAYAMYSSDSPTILVECQKSDGSMRYDRVYVNPVVSAASLQITNPNGGANIDPAQPLNITFSQQGIKSYSAALYKNDQWKYWIAKDVPIQGENNLQINTWYSAVTALQTLGESNNRDAVFKIYITGQKADGSGYIDDKSDAPFGFVSSGVPSVSISSASSVLRNTIDKADITYDVNNAPSGAAIEIVLKNAQGMSSGEMQIVSRYQLDGTTRTFDLSQAQQTFPSHGHLTWSASYADSLVPIGGPVQIRLFSSDGTLLGLANAPLRIEANTTSAPTITFAADPSTISAGENATFKWTVANATYCKLSSPYGGWEGSPTETFSPMSFNNVKEGFTATLTCTGPGGSVTKSVTVNVGQSAPNPVINAFYASPESVSAGNSSTLSWNAGNTAQCGISVISGNAPGLDLSKATTGGEGLTSVSTGTLNQSATYELRCAPLTGATGGYAIKSVTVTVQPTATLTTQTASASTAQARNAIRSSNIADLAKALSGQLPPSGGQVCVSASCYGQWSGFAANVAVDAVITASMQKPADPSDSTRQAGGYLYFDPKSWGGIPGFSSGYYLDWLAEPADDANAACAPGRAAGRYGTYIGCLMKIGTAPLSVNQSGRDANLASSLTALEMALKTLLQTLRK